MRTFPTATRPAAVLAVLGLTLAGCSSSSDDDDSAGTQPEPTAATTATGSDTPATTASNGAVAPAGFPRRVKTSHGDVEIKAEPKQIVVLGMPYAEALLALGVTPAVVDTSGAEMVPWMKGKTGGVKLTALTTGQNLNIEAVAAARPDLILAGNWITRQRDTAKKLNAIAPTVDVPTKAINPDWDAAITTTADAIGKPADGAALVTKLKKQMKDSTTGLPAGTTYNWVRYDANGWGMGNGILLDSFGLKPATAQDNSNVTVISPEQTQKLDGDVLFVWPWGKSEADVKAVAGVSALPSSKKGTLQVVDLNFATALNSPGAYSIPWVINEIKPTFAKLR